MTLATALGVACAATCMATDWWSVGRSRPRVERVAKPGVMIALIAVVLTLDVDPSSARVWILAGLVAGLAGDIALLPDVDRFIVGLGAFLVGHLAYVVSFGLMWDASPTLAIGGLGAMALVLGFGIPLERALRGSALRVPVAAYIAVTLAVIVTGSGTGRWPIIVGTLAFATSDGLLGRDRFVRSAPGHRVWVHVLYQLGQAAIVAGAVAA